MNMFAFDAIWFFLLLPLPLLMVFFAPPRKEAKPAVHIPFFSELVSLTGRKTDKDAVVPKQAWFRQAMVTLCWILLVAAAARPQWIESAVVKEIASRDLLLGVDLSASMDTTDFTAVDGRTVSRLDAVKEVLDDFLERRKGDRVGLIFFGSAPFIQVPFTEDLKTCRSLLEEAQVGMAGPKTAVGDTIGLAINMFQESTVKEKVLILLTDGNDTSSGIPPSKAARIASDNQISIFTVAVGDPAAVGEEKLDEATLREIARTTGGQYYFAGNRTELAKIYDRLDRLGTRDIETVSYRPRRDLYHWPLGAAILVSLFFHVFMALWAHYREHHSKPNQVHHQTHHPMGDPP